ncbi:MAG: glycosyltransferase [Acidiferrobacterales bacterium]
MNKDLIDDRYGRFREIPLQLAGLGHEVVGSCLSYKTKRELTIRDPIDQAHVEWHSYNAGWLKLPGLIRYFFNTYRLARRIQPDMIIAASDSIYGIVAMFLGRMLGKPFVFDLYDNFESFGAIKLPFVRRLYASAIRKADLLSVVSEPLRQHVIEDYSRKGPTIELQNGIDEKLFHPLSKIECRMDLGLPQDAILVGVTGAISHSRGIEIVFPALARLSKDLPGLYLVLAGKIDKDIEIGPSPNIIILGELPYDKMPRVIASLDVSVISNVDSLFGHYCYPQKFVEAVACEIPPVVAAVGAMHLLLRDTPEILFKPQDVDDLVRAIQYQLTHKLVPTKTVWSWNELARKLSNELELL